MELKDLHWLVVVLILVGMLIGIGVLVMDRFADAGSISTTITNESFVMPAENGTVSLAQANLTSFTKVMNSSGDTLGSGNYSVNLTTGVYNNSGNSTGFVTGQTVYAYYVYDDYTGKAVTALRATRDAIGSIATDWLPSIIIVAVLAIILTLVISSFAGVGGRRSG